MSLYKDFALAARTLSFKKHFRRHAPSAISKWYFACNANAFAHAFDQIEVAVLSACMRTRLTPILLLDLPAPTPTDMERIAWLEGMGVAIRPHRAEMFAPVREYFGTAADNYDGHWLRCDIPILETSDRFVLYTDIDVVFRADVGFSDIAPRFVACAPEFEQTEYSYFNSGVMIMNIAALRKSRRRFAGDLKRMLPSLKPYEDQKVFNATYQNAWERLPNSWNWKPYWGFDDQAAIVHFHGPKPGLVRRMIAGDVAGIDAESLRLYSLSPVGYARYIDEIDVLLKSR